MAKVEVPGSPTPGVMVTMGLRLDHMIINRLNVPSDGDIVVPQRTPSIIGTTSWSVDDPDHIPIPGDHVTLTVVGMGFGVRAQRTMLIVASVAAVVATVTGAGLLFGD